MPRHAPQSLIPLLLIAAACGGDDGTDPDDFDPSDLIGTYFLDPAPVVTCSFSGGDATLTFDRLIISGANDESIDATLRFDYEFDTRFGTGTVDIPMTFGDESDEAGGTETLAYTNGIGDGQFDATGAVSLGVEFDDTDSFQGDLMTVTTATFQGTVFETVDCDDVDIAVTGQRE